MWINLAGMAGTGLPLGLLLAFVAHLGVMGLLLGLTAGVRLAVSAAASCQGVGGRLQHCGVQAKQSTLRRLSCRAAPTWPSSGSRTGPRWQPRWLQSTRHKILRLGKGLERAAHGMGCGREL